jgi:hypothetical protein
MLVALQSMTILSIAGCTPTKSTNRAERLRRGLVFWLSTGARGSRGRVAKYYDTITQNSGRLDSVGEKRVTY